MTVGFDVLSDLNLTPDENFNWENKATSLYCIIAGNISNDLRTIHQTLLHLSKFYQGIFYIPGSLELKDIDRIPNRLEDLYKICSSVRTVALLHNHVVVVDGTAIMGATCWYGNTPDQDAYTELKKDTYRYEDISYMSMTLERLQLHLDVKKIIIVTHSAPSEELFFGELPNNIKDQMPAMGILNRDSENKVTHWVFGSYNKTVDTTIDNINYINNSYYKRKPYWAKRIDVDLNL
jgi:hypothetical protein